jgi:hypothetical protein
VSVYRYRYMICMAKDTFTFHIESIPCIRWLDTPKIITSKRFIEMQRGFHLIMRLFSLSRTPCHSAPYSRSTEIEKNRSQDQVTLQTPTLNSLGLMHRGHPPITRIFPPSRPSYHSAPYSRRTEIEKTNSGPKHHSLPPVPKST